MKRALGGLAALTLSAALALPGSGQDAPNRLQNKRIQEVVEQHWNTGGLVVEQLGAAMPNYDALVASRFHPRAKEIAGIYSNTTLDFALITSGTQVFAGTFDRSLPNQNSILSLVPVDGREARFMRALYDDSKFGIAPVGSVAIADQGAYVAGLFTRARGDADFGANVAGIDSHVNAALVAAGDNKGAFLSAMDGMNPRELVLALNLLSVMGNDDYGFSVQGAGVVQRDLNVQTAAEFRDNVQASAQVLAAFPWAMNEARRDWAKYVSGVLDTRFTNESSVPGLRRLLFSAVRELASDAASAEEALQRIATVGPKIIRFTPRVAQEDATAVDVLRSHRATAEYMAEVGTLLSRAAGIPSSPTAIPRHVHMLGNHIFTLSESAGAPHGWLFGETPNLHTYDITRPDLGWVDVRGHLTKEGYVVAKAYALERTAGSTVARDVTDRITSTAPLVYNVGANHAGELVRLGTYVNQGGRCQFSRISDDAVRVAADGTVRFEKVGCVPYPAAQVNGQEARDGMLYAILADVPREREATDVRYLSAPIVHFPSGRDQAVAMYRHGNLAVNDVLQRNASVNLPQVEVRGFPANASVDVRVLYERASDRKMDSMVFEGPISTDANGVLRLPGLNADTLLFWKPSGAGFDQLRPAIVREERDGNFYAHQRGQR